MKHNAQVALEQSYNFLTHIGEQRVLTNKVLISKSDGNAEKTCHIPVLICETISDDQQTTRTEINVPEEMSNDTASIVYSSIRANNELPWANAEVSPIVGDEFAKLLDSSNASDRVKELIKKMYDRTNYETI